MPETESALVARCRDGDPAAWDELFNRHYDPVARFLFQFSPDFSVEDVEDLCQEVFLSAVRHLRSFGGRSALQTWLFRIAMNKARDAVEKRQAAKRGGGQVPRSLDEPHPETGAARELPSPATAPDDTLAQAETGSLLRAALEALGDPCRTLIELRYFGDLSYEAIAREFGITVKAAGSRLHKCLARLAVLAGPRLGAGAADKKPSNLKPGA